MRYFREKNKFGSRKMRAAGIIIFILCLFFHPENLLARTLAAEHIVPVEPAIIESPVVESGGNTLYHDPSAVLGMGKESFSKKVLHPLFQGIDSIDFTFGVLPDTQFYSKSYPETFNRINQWFVTNQKALNLNYVFHLGDIVNNMTEDSQWERASEAMRLFEQAEIPYGIIAGNHDVGTPDNYASFSRFFGTNRYRSDPWHGGSYQKNKGHYDLINVSGRKFIMLGMGWGIGEGETAWMNKVLRNYPDRTAILFVHDYLNKDGNRTQEGEMIFREIVRGNASVRLVLNGHYSGAARKTDILDDNGDGKPDRRVTQILSDYQSINGGEGFIRVMGFDLTHGRVYVRTFSPCNGRTQAYGTEKDNFSFRFD